MSRSTDADVVVVGAGPAGSSTAIACASAGLRVLVVERAAFPRTLPGETLHPGVEPILRQLGVWDAIVARGWIRHRGVRIAWNGAPRFEAYGDSDGVPWEGLQAPRAEFDALLLQRARDLGVEVRQPCSADAVLVEEGRVTGIVADGETLRARFVVDASGRRQWLASQLRLAHAQYSPRLIAWYGYARGVCEDVVEAPLLDGDANGWTWIARVAPDTYQWTRVSFAEELLPKAWRPPRLAACAPLGDTAGADVTWRIAPPAGRGWFIAGDAAAVLDPASSHGVLKALMCGIYIGSVVQAPEDAAIAAYTQWVQSWFAHDVTALRTLYGELAER
ncbi:MAG TPA: NAD(P)/FAD-dependent oxidoreductase [Thermoanaerobaculia bacterium]